MNWKNSLFKPRWRHKHPSIRNQAVKTGQEPELLQAMFDIATKDEDVQVRISASRRLKDPLQIIEALGREETDAVRSALSDRLKHLLLHPAEADGGSDSRQRAVALIDSRDLLEAIAASAPEVSLRRIALEKTARPGFLGDRAIHDTDPELRRYAAGLIQQHSTLRRVIDATRKTDKQLHSELSDRLHRELLAAGDPQAIRQEALHLCQSVETRLHQAQATDEADIQSMEQRWKALGPNPPAELASRFAADLQRLRSPAPAPRQAPPEDEPPPAALAVAAAPQQDKPAENTAEGPDREPGDIHPDLQAAWDAIDTAAQHKRPPASREIDILSRAWERARSAVKDFTNAEEELQTRVIDALEQLHTGAQALRDQREQWLAQADEHLSAMKAALDAGELHSALEHRAALQKLKESLSGSREWKAIQSKLSGALGRLRELRDWHHWANDKIRKRLITEMEALPGAGLHPDAVLDRIKALQSEWKTLEASEQIPGDRHYAAAPWMWRKFNAAGKSAFELTKPYLDKRSELRSRNLEEIHRAARELNDLCDRQAVDLKQVSRQAGKVRKALGDLDAIPGKQRQKTAELLKQALGRANDLKQGHYSEIEKRKLKLVREASQLKHMTDRDEAIARAKYLQSQWKSAGSLWRSRDNELWQQFREPIEPLFADLEAERESARAEQAERTAGQEQLCVQLESLLQTEDEQLAEQLGRVQGLADEWQHYRKPDRRLKARFDKAHLAVQNRINAYQQAAAREQKARWWKKSELLHQAESANTGGKLDKAQLGKLTAEWAKLIGTAHPIDEALDARFAALGERDGAPGAGSEPEILESARRICISLEYLAGISSPEEEKETRMQYQVERLSASMTGERERVPAVEEARQLEQDWLLHEYIPEPHYPEFEQRVRNALSNILEE